MQLSNFHKIFKPQNYIKLMAEDKKKSGEGEEVVDEKAEDLEKKQ